MAENNRDSNDNIIIVRTRKDRTPLPAGRPQQQEATPATPQAVTSEPTADDTEVEEEAELQKCNHCKMELPLSKFQPSTRRGNRSVPVKTCQRCRNAARGTLERRLKKKQEETPPGQRLCRSCENPFAPGDEDRLRCADCRAKQLRQVRARAREKEREQEAEEAKKRVKGELDRKELEVAHTLVAMGRGELGPQSPTPNHLRAHLDHVEDEVTLGIKVATLLGGNDEASRHDRD
jgi:hypothetical protein